MAMYATSGIEKHHYFLTLLLPIIGHEYCQQQRPTMDRGSWTWDSRHLVVLGFCIYDRQSGNFVGIAIEMFPAVWMKGWKESLSKGLSNHGLKAKSSKKKGTKLLNKTSDSTPHTDTQVALVESIINKLKCIGMIYIYIYKLPHQLVQTPISK